MKFLAFTTLLFLAGCGSSCGKVHFPPDPRPNYANLGFYNMELDAIKPGNPVEKSLGITSITLEEGQSLDDVYVDFYGYYTGMITLRSNSCPVNYSTSFSGGKRFAIRDFMAVPTSCTIEMAMAIDRIEGLEHNMSEIGRMDFFMLPKNRRPVMISYYRSSSFGLQKREFVGNANYQRPEGNAPRNEIITFSTDSTRGQYAVTNTCGKPALMGAYMSNEIKLSISKLYGDAGEIKLDEGCEFYISVVPEESGYLPYNGKLSVNIYSKDVTPLEYPFYRIDKRITVWGNSYVAATAINGTYSKAGKYKVENKISTKNLPGVTFWVRAVTINGRKSVFAIRDNQIVWW